MLNRRHFLHRLGAGTLGAAVFSIGHAATPGKTLRYNNTKGIREKPLQALDQFIEKEITNGTIPGAALMATRHGKTFFTGTWGTYCSRTNKSDEVTPGIVVPFFSYSKVVGATVLATVVQDGLLKWDEPVKTYIPEMTGGGKDSITLRHLLTHSAGIPSVDIAHVGSEQDWQTAMKKIYAAKVDWEPGSKCLYHGLTGQLVAAEAARRVLKNQSWPEMARERLFKKLGAASLTYGSVPASAPVALIPQPVSVPAEHGTLGNILPGQPAGGCFGTMEDGLKILHLHLQKGQWNGKTILKKEVFQEMHRVQYAQEMQKALDEKKPVVHQSWGLGPLLRGPFPADGGHAWFGFRDQKNPTIFGHAGIDSVIGVADPATQVALFFVTTNSPKAQPKATQLRNEVTNRVLEAAE